MNEPEYDVPPAIAAPEPGQQVGAGPVCPVCGAPTAAWFYNPFSRRSQDGWVLIRGLVCRCPGRDPLAPPPPSGGAGAEYPAWLDREFLQEAVRGQTFRTFDLRTQPRLRETYEAALAYAQRFDGSTRRGLYIAGRPQTGKGHLAAALVEEARAAGFQALALSQARLLELTLPEASARAAEQALCQQRRKAVRAVPVLAIRDLLPVVPLPSQLRELDLLLEHRADHGRVTHFTAFETPARLRQRPDWGRLRFATIALLHRVESLTEAPLLVHPCAPAYTVRQQRARAGG